MEAVVALSTWNYVCSIGVRAMDNQHNILMDTMNELHLAAVRGSGREQVNDAMDRLIAFSRMHFRSEEQLMEQYGYPGLEEHRADHQRIMTQILQSAHRTQHGERIQMRPLLSFMREAYAEHIEGLDRLYGPWLNEHGVS
jgi:hemerythrin-like metal-binding protein